MATTQTVQYRDIVLTQGGADAFVQATEYTGIDPSVGNCWRIAKCEFLFNTGCGIEAVSADFNIQWSLTRESVAASTDLSNADALYADGIAGSLTTNGQIMILRRYEWSPPAGMVVVAPSIYAQLDSTATGLTLSATMRVYFEYVKLSELSILQMLSQG